ncbi:MAG: hypothetical protein KAS59_00770 [Alphaproteobacteria bacterium]|nr:hypothetical protein [Alphaproteobacteria bacterium]
MTNKNGINIYKYGKVSKKEADILIAQSLIYRSKAGGLRMRTLGCASLDTTKRAIKAALAS